MTYTSSRPIQLSASNLDPYNKRDDLKKEAKRLAQKYNIEAPNFKLMDKGALREWINSASSKASSSNGGGSGNGSGGGGGSSAENNLYQNAKDLAQQQQSFDLEKMKAAAGYRSAETDQTRGWDRTIQGDKLASDERINQYGVDADKWKTQYTTDAQERMNRWNGDVDKWKTEVTTNADKWKTAYTTDAQERMQIRGFGQEKDMANLNSTLKMREGEQQYGFQLNLQRDNNAARERMQQAGFTQEKEMLTKRVEADQESKRISALRAARAFKGEIPTGI